MINYEWVFVQSGSAWLAVLTRTDQLRGVMISLVYNYDVWTLSGVSTGQQSVRWKYLTPQTKGWFVVLQSVLLVSILWLLEFLSFSAIVSVNY